MVTPILHLFWLFYPFIESYGYIIYWYTIPRVQDPV